MTGLALAYGASKFVMGAVSDRSNPKYFITAGLLLSCGLMAVSGLVKAIYASLALVILIQILNSWVQGMGWPPCGKTMVHWFGTRERGVVVAFWNVSHNVGRPYCRRAHGTNQWHLAGMPDRRSRAHRRHPEGPIAVLRQRAQRSVSSGCGERAAFEVTKGDGLELTHSGGW